MRRLAIAVVVLLTGCLQRELMLPDVRQTEDYTCGASALQAVLAYYGIEASEAELATATGTTSADGAPPEAIARAARDHGLTVAIREGVSIAELRREVRAKRPVIVDIQAWANTPRSNWQNDWEDGHYVVVIAVDRDRVVFEDPSILGGRGYLRFEELLQRWHDEDKGRKSSRLGIFFGGRSPAPAAKLQHID
jgi:predicted double-glycine peptidase